MFDLSLALYDQHDLLIFKRIFFFSNHVSIIMVAVLIHSWANDIDIAFALSLVFMFFQTRFTQELLNEK